MRAVLDVNVLISAVLSRHGPPAGILLAWRDGRFDLIVSPSLLAELRRAMGYKKIRSRLDAADAEAFLRWLAESAQLVPDASLPTPVRSVDPDDDYLIALAAEQDAILVTGDRGLLELAGDQPIRDPASFLAQLD